MARMSIELLLPWRGVAAALVVALAWAGLFRLLRRGDLASLGAGIGLAVGWALALGIVAGTPRQLPERLPVVVIGGALAGFVLAVAGRRGAISLLLAALGLLGAAWWLAGGPLTLPDLRRGMVLLLALVALGAAALLALRGPVGAAAAMALLAAGLWFFGPLGPWFLLALIGLAAVLGALPAGAWGSAAALPVAIGLAALAAGPVLARGSTADWLVAAAPFAALWLGPALGGRIGGRAGEPVGWAMAGLLPLIFVWLLHWGR
jgi:hypothetical protein